MKKLTSIAILFILSNSLFGQHEIRLLPFEFKIGLNHPVNYDDVSTKCGYNREMKRLWHQDKIFNVLSGLAFESLYYDVDYEPCSQFCDFEDMKYNALSLSVPLLLRINLGQKIKVFFESGIDLKYILGVYYHGTMASFQPGEETTYKAIDGDARSYNFSVGINAGAGLTFPIKNQRFVISCSYRNKITNRYIDYAYTEFVKLQVGAIIK